MNKKKYEIPTTTTFNVQIESLLESASPAEEPNTPAGSRENTSDWDD